MMNHTPNKAPFHANRRSTWALAALIAAVSWPLAAQNPPALDGNAVIAHLSAVITWYRDVTTKAKGTGLPSDAIYQDNVQNLAIQSVQLAFQSARAEAALIAAAQGKPGDAGSGEASQKSSQQQKMSQAKEKLAAQILGLQSQIGSLDKKVALASAASRPKLISQRDNLQEELDLDNAMEDTIGKMDSFLTSTQATTQGLQGRINQLARSVPEALAASNTPKQAAQQASAAPAPANSVGLIGQALILYGHMSSMHTMDQLAEETNNLRKTADGLRQPLRQTLVATIQRGHVLGGQTGIPAPSQPPSAKQDSQDLTAQFKQLSDAAVPLSQEVVLLDNTSANLKEWRDSISQESRTVLESLLARVTAILVALIVVLVLSEIGRRFAFRHMHDSRRRRRFLLLRRFATGFLIATILILGFVSEFSSLATFAGFLTAGIAVSLQAVILSVAAYFYLIGRYGVRVGDRISVAGVTGDVLDIGLTRLHVVELAGTGVDLYPTGRIVMLSNSVFFQAATPLFKQIPGTEFAWHEIALGLAPGANYRLLQEKLLAAVNSVYAKYKGEIERQHDNIERRIEIDLQVPVPVAQLQFTEAGLELVVRYPVEIRRSSDIDDELTLALLEIIENEPDLKATVSGLPKIRAAVRG
jgi:small-conductance mechanosensitive channel